jgi:hypothetical protein
MALSFAEQMSFHQALVSISRKSKWQTFEIRKVVFNHTTKAEPYINVLLREDI